MHYKAERALEKVERIIEYAISQHYSYQHVVNLSILRKDIIDLGNELDDADFDTWLANHQGLLDDINE